MSADVQRIVDAAMEQVLEFRNLLTYRDGQIERLKGTPGTTQRTIDKLVSQRDDRAKTYEGMRTLLAHVLSAAGYAVSKPFPDGSGSMPSALLAEDELDKWARVRKATA